jgi:ferredoxin
MALAQRFLKPGRFDGSNARDALIILLLVATVVAGMLMQTACQVATGADPSAPWRPLSRLIASGLTAAGVTSETAGQGATLFAWVHMLAILGFLLYMPGSRHLHMLIGIPIVFVRKLGPSGRLEPLDLEAGQLGVSDVGQLKRKQVLDLLACTECGRCQEMCPAHAAGKPLSPKRLIMNLRDHLLETRGIGGHRADFGAPLIGETIPQETLWSCTTCGACMAACPLFIEHVPKTVDMRRHVAMELGSLPDGVSGAVLSIETWPSLGWNIVFAARLVRGPKGPRPATGRADRHAAVGRLHGGAGRACAKSRARAGRPLATRGRRVRHSR